MDKSMAWLQAINYSHPVNCWGCASILLDVCNIFTIVQGVQGALVAGDTDFLPQGLSDGTMVTRLLHQRVNSLYVSPSCQRLSSLKLQVVLDGWEMHWSIDFLFNLYCSLDCISAMWI
jgi:hypothetical protein